MKKKKTSYIVFTAYTIIEEKLPLSFYISVYSVELCDYYCVIIICIIGLQGNIYLQQI